MRLTKKNQVLFEDMMKRIGLHEKFKNKGKNEGRKEIAKKMLRRGTPVDIVAEDTSLSIDEVDNLKKELSN